MSLSKLYDELKAEHEAVMGKGPLVTPIPAKATPEERTEYQRVDAVRATLQKAFDYLTVPPNFDPPGDQVANYRGAVAAYRLEINKTPARTAPAPRVPTPAPRNPGDPRVPAPAQRPPVVAHADPDHPAHLDPVHHVPEA